MRASLEMSVKQENWKSAAIRVSNLSELELTRGDLAGAVQDAAQSVEYAARSGDAFRQINMRTTHADALHQADRRAEAKRASAKAEQMQADNRPDYPLLYIPCKASSIATCCSRGRSGRRGEWRRAEGGGRIAE
ncbi:MAG: hypothetical protein U0Y68_08830 [Blastocatellia bacterium]